MCLYVSCPRLTPSLHFILHMALCLWYCIIDFVRKSVCVYIAKTKREREREPVKSTTAHETRESARREQDSLVLKESPDYHSPLDHVMRSRYIFSAGAKKVIIIKKPYLATARMKL